MRLFVLLRFGIGVVFWRANFTLCGSIVLLRVPAFCRAVIILTLISFNETGWEREQVVLLFVKFNCAKLAIIISGMRPHITSDVIIVSDNFPMIFFNAGWYFFLPHHA